MAENVFGAMLLEAAGDMGLDMSVMEYRKHWPVIAGARLSSCTRLIALDERRGTLRISVSSPSVRTLVSMEKAGVVARWNSVFPDLKIKDIVCVKRT